ncbi:hypothetical protein QTI24_30525 [Variovorax sp. J22P240]|uniref:hypothetical protein n=1 Tax=Variovorax sp. J22P240 TaxID=3053514 RepID=UPI00257591B3|nr:hypothetical protein [Variovorax sp. J22P240]MDM0002958.1 hypothetical protein [Variovorax sp. J22P240]
MGDTKAATIVEVLDKNKEAAEEVKKVADDLLVVHTVLKEESPLDCAAELVDRAVEQAGELEKRLTKSAALLDEVNESLEQAAKGDKASEEGRDGRSAPHHTDMSG